MPRLCAVVAQLVEHVIRNDGVGGSIPLSGTIQIKGLAKASPLSFLGQKCPKHDSPAQKAMDWSVGEVQVGETVKDDRTAYNG
jgi:hypothetical protein